ncbi:IdeS/Mac family cysteine endopeptidase [Mycoplasma sp. SK341A]|uniref:IdeS/Mac family cysteine endopeptidase n=1 Tax=Mycoplasma sp. SK341A TaxID=3401679 RepID=UPI003AAEE128
MKKFKLVLGALATPVLLPIITISCSDDKKQMQEHIKTQDKQISILQDSLNQKQTALNQTSTLLNSTLEQLSQVQKSLSTSNNQVAQLNNQITELSTNNKALQADLDSKNALLAQKQAQIKELNETLASQPDKVEFTNLKHQLATKEQEIASLKQQINAANDSKTKLQSQISSLQEQLALVTKQKEQLQQEANNKQALDAAKIEQLNNQIAQLNSDLDQANKQKQDISDQVESFSAQLQAANITNKNLQEQLDKKTNQIQQALRDYNILNQQAEGLRQQITQLETTISDNEAKIQTKNNTIAALKTIIADNKNQISLLTEQKSSLELNIENLTSQLNSTKEQLASALKQNQDLQNQIKKLVDEVEKLKKQNSSSTSGENKDKDQPNPSHSDTGASNPTTNSNQNNNPSSSQDLANANLMFKLKDNYIVAKNDKSFNLNSLVTINSNYQAKEIKNTINSHGILTPDGVTIPAINTSNIETLKPGKALSNPPVGRWFRTEKQFDPDDYRYYLMWDEAANWFDANKWFRYTPNIDKSDEDNYYPMRYFGNGGTDDRSCWAAASSNIMMWWIQQNHKYIEAYYKIHPEDKILMLNGKDILQSYNEKDYAFIFNFLVEYFTDTSGYALFGNEWLLSGEKNPNFNASIEVDKAKQAAQFKGLFPHLFNWDNVSKLGDYKKLAGGVTNADKVFSNYVKEAFENHYAVSFVINPSASYNHAVTLWGAHYNSDGIIDEIYYANSDHNNKEMRTRSRLERAKVVYSPDKRNIRIWLAPDQTNYEEQNRNGYLIASVEKFNLGHDIWEKWYKENVNATDDKVVINVLNADQFDISKPGIYQIKYQGTDKFGNTQTQVANITVK